MNGGIRRPEQRAGNSAKPIGWHGRIQMLHITHIHMHAVRGRGDHKEAILSESGGMGIYYWLIVGCCCCFMSCGLGIVFVYKFRDDDELVNGKLLSTA